MIGALAGIFSGMGCGGRADLEETPPPCTCPPEQSDGGLLAFDAGPADASDAPDALENDRTQTGDDADETGETGETGDAAGVTEDAIAEEPPSVTYPTHCYDQVQNGTETDVDCGGDCAGCTLGQACVTNADCGIGAGCDAPNGGCTCDANTRLCVYNHCFDSKLDGDETGVDCGGSVCTGCGPGEPCNVDTDCSATASGCDPTHEGCACDAISGLCIYSHCFDHKMDYGESDVDCGGPCSPCVVGSACVNDADCALQACDAISKACVMNPCADHQRDGQESDVDCGGISCSSCPVGKHCNSNLDCAPGHFCNGQKVCQ
jgi:hypothetical protein